MVRYLLDQGVRQFLDLGSGIPTMGHVHEVAHEIDPAARVVYVDSDAGVAADARQLLAGNDRTLVLDSDIREPEAVLAAAAALLDLTEPVGLLVIATLQHLPDSDDPVGLVAAYVDALCSGSYLASAHHGPDQHLEDGYRLFDQMQLGRRPEVSLRDQARSGMIFAGLELVEPGIVPLVLWRPDPDDELGRNPERLPIFAGVGRKP
jgi:trans-aconitate methyltransferase